MASMEALQADLDRASAALAFARSSAAAWRTGALAGAAGLAGALLLPSAGLPAAHGAMAGVALGAAGGLLWWWIETRPGQGQKK